MAPGKKKRGIKPAVTNDFNFIDIFEDVDTKIAALLRKSNNAKAPEKLSQKEKDELWVLLLDLIKKFPSDAENTEDFSILINMIDLLHAFLTSNSDIIKGNAKFIEILRHLNGNEFLISFGMENPKVKNNVSKLNEYWMAKVEDKEEIPGMEYFTLKHLFQLCLAEKPLVSDIQRLSAIRKAVTNVPFEKMIPSLRSMLIKLAQSPTVLASDHGQRFFAHVLTLSQKLMSDIHKTIMLELNSCNKKKASCYGKIYVSSWHNASDDMKTALEKSCFQHLTETFLKEQRTSLELTKHGQNMLAVLEVWHSERKKKNSEFITMLTDAYEPVLWKYLKSGFNVHRCNAADVFFKAFPLERPNESVLEAERLFNEQFSTMEALLVDDCHIVRIIAVREICNILSHYWNQFTPGQIQKLMSVILKDNVNDASTAEGRRMVFVGLQSLLNNPLSFDYLKQVLPSLADRIHDVNPRVRTSFIQLLIAIKEKKDPNFKYSDIVPAFSLYYRLAVDNTNVGQWVVKLLMSYYYQPNMPVIEWTKRFIYLIRTYRKSYRNFFLFSSKTLPFPDAVNIISEVLTQIGVYVMSKLSADQDDSEENNEDIISVNKNKNKKGRGKAPLQDWNGKANSPPTEVEKPKNCAFDDPIVVSGLFDIVTILWVLHDKNLNKPENEEERLKLYDTYIKYAQPFINYYKDSDLFLSILSLSGNIPASLLRSNSITLPGYCIKMLKSIKLDKFEEKNENIVSMLLALVKWKRGSEILEQVSLWLDAAFETQDMNETIFPRRRVKISETIQPDSVVGIYIINTLLKIEHARLSILKNNYDQLFDLWKFMSRVQQLIATRLNQGEPFAEELVSDQFLHLCFRRYVKFIPLLKGESGKLAEEEKEEKSRNNETNDVVNATDSSSISDKVINHQKEIEKVIDWSENVLYPLLEQDLDEADAELVTNLLNDVLYVSDNMITIHLVNSFFYIKVGHFILKLLKTNYKLYFLKSASRIALVLNHSAKLLFTVNDDYQIFSKMVPSIVSHVLSILENKDISIEELKKHEEDLQEVKTNFNKILATYQDNFQSKTSSRESVRQLQLVVELFVECIVSLVAQEIPREDMSVPIYSNISQLPMVAHFLMSMFYNKKFWGPIFVHVLNKQLSTKTYQCKSLVASILLLHLISTNDKKVNKSELKKAINTATDCLNKEKSLIFKEKQRRNDLDGLTESVNNVFLSLPKESWPSDAPTNTDCGLWGSKERRTGSGVKDDGTSHMAIDQTDERRLTISDKTNMNEDLVNCGLELAKNIENLLNKPEQEQDEE